MTGTEDRFVIVEPDDGDVFGPYNKAELRMAMLEDLIQRDGDEDDTPEHEAAEYRAMTTESLFDEYVSTTGCDIRIISSPTAEWRRSVLLERAKEDGIDG